MMSLRKLHFVWSLNMHDKSLSYLTRLTSLERLTLRVNAVLPSFSPLINLRALDLSDCPVRDYQSFWLLF